MAARSSRKEPGHAASLAAAFLLASVFPGRAASAPERVIDLERSIVRVRVGKTGPLSLFAHEHLVAAPLGEAVLRLEPALQVDLRFEAKALRVLDADLSPADRSAVQRVMEGPEVLNADRYPEIRFRSTAVEPHGAGRWSVAGELTLHGQTRPLRADVALRDGRYRGSASFRQSDFAITPVRFAAGAVRVRDEVGVEFAIAVEGP